MIKYSQRGLVVNGKVAFLFYLLYLLINVVFYSQWSFFILLRFLREASNKKNETFVASEPPLLM